MIETLIYADDYSQTGYGLWVVMAGTRYPTAVLISPSDGTERLEDPRDLNLPDSSLLSKEKARTIHIIQTSGSVFAS